MPSGVNTSTRLFPYQRHARTRSNSPLSRWERRNCLYHFPHGPTPPHRCIRCEHPTRLFPVSTTCTYPVPFTAIRGSGEIASLFRFDPIAVYRCHRNVNIWTRVITPVSNVDIPGRIHCYPIGIPELAVTRFQTCPIFFTKALFESNFQTLWFTLSVT